MQVNHNAVAGSSSGRPRGTDPTTADRYYSDEESEFMRKVAEYKKATGRVYLNLSEYFDIMVNQLGYTRQRPEPARASIRTRTCSVV